MSLVRRKIDLTFQLGQGDFGEDGYDTVKVSGLRVSASISKAGGTSQTTLALRVYGLTPKLMNQLTTLGKPLIVSGKNNVVVVEAGDDTSGMAIVFAGIINQAWADGAGSPAVCLTVSAVTGLLDQTKPVPPTSFAGSFDVATAMSGFAELMARTFVNSGVQVTLPSSYFSGTAKDQAFSLAQHADINISLEGEANQGGVLAIWPKDSPRDGVVPLISKDTGLVGYPTFTSNGISLQTLFNPTIQFGCNIEVQSVFQPACGKWTTFSIGHELESETPNGRWFTTLQASLFGHTLPVDV